MEAVKNDNQTMYYSDGRLLLTITELGNDEFITENSVNRLQGICKNIDDYKTLIQLKYNQTKGKNGRYYESKKLFEHNTRWFCYILQEYGFVKKTIAIR